MDIKYKTHLDNALKIMRRSKLTEVEGVEILAFAQAYSAIEELSKQCKEPEKDMTPIKEVKKPKKVKKDESVNIRS